MITELSYFVKIFGFCLIGIGMYFLFTAIFGFAKFRDPFKMVHVGGIFDLVGSPAIMLGCGVIFASEGDFSAMFKIIFLVVIMYITSPISTNAISEATVRMRSDIILDKNHGEKTLDN